MAKKHTSHWANLILYPPKESLGRAGKNLTLEMSVGCAQVSQELIMPKTHFGRFDHEAVYGFLIFLRVVNPWTICQKMRYMLDLHLYSKVSKLNFENPKKFQKFWKIFFCSNFHLICFRMPKNELWQLFFACHGHSPDFWYPANRWYSPESMN